MGLAGICSNLFRPAFAKASSFAEAAADKTADKKGLEKKGVFLLR